MSQLVCAENEEHKAENGISSFSDTEEESKPFKYSESELKPTKSLEDFQCRFQLGKCLGSGGDGDVYADVSKSWAAIKRIDLDEFDDAEHEIFRAQQEQRLLAKGKIANIYGIYHDVDGHVMYKVYDKYDHSLYDLMDHLEVGMTESQIRHVIHGVCSDVRRLHAQGFIHSDLKPSNVMYSKHGTHKMRHRDADTFKVIDFDGVIWNSTNDVITTQWQGSLPFCAPEMNDYVGDENHIGYGVDVWQIGLLILYMVNAGDLGAMDISDLEHERFYADYGEEEAMEIKGDIFDSWYGSLFGAGSPYKRIMTELFKTGKIGASLFDLLYHCILVKDPQRRFSVEEVLNHEWFLEEDLEYDGSIEIGDEWRNLFDAIMSDDEDTKLAVMTQQIARLGIGGGDHGNLSGNECDDDEENENENEIDGAVSVKGDIAEEDSPEINFYFDSVLDDATTDTDFCSSSRPKLGYCSSARPESPTQSTRTRTMSF